MEGLPDYQEFELGLHYPTRLLKIGLRQGYNLITDYYGWFAVRSHSHTNLVWRDSQQWGYTSMFKKSDFKKKWKLEEETGRIKKKYIYNDILQPLTNQFEKVFMKVMPPSPLYSHSSQYRYSFSFELHPAYCILVHLSVV